MRRRNEAALIESQNKYRALFDNLNESLSIDELLYDDQGNPSGWRVLDVNSVYLHFSRRSRNEVVGRHDANFFPCHIKPFSAFHRKGPAPRRQQNR